MSASKAYSFVYIVERVLSLSLFLFFALSFDLFVDERTRITKRKTKETEKERKKNTQLFNFHSCYSCCYYRNKYKIIYIN